MRNADMTANSDRRRPPMVPTDLAAEVPPHVDDSSRPHLGAPLLLWLLLLLPNLAHGMPANPRPFSVRHGPPAAEPGRQETVLLRLNGDPTHQYLTDVAGFTCLLDEDTGYYRYAVRASSVVRASSSVLDGDGVEKDGQHLPYWQERHPDDLVPHPTAVCGSLSNPAEELDGVDGRRMVPPAHIRRERCGPYCADRDRRRERRRRERQRQRQRMLAEEGGGGDGSGSRRMLRGDGGGAAPPEEEEESHAITVTGDPLFVVPAIPLEEHGRSNSEKEKEEQQQRQLFHESVRSQLRDQLRHLASGADGDDAVGSGTLRCLIVPFRFADHAGRPLPDRSDLQIMVGHDGKDPLLAPTGSVRYALDQFSYGKLKLEPTVWDWVTLPKTEKHYSGASLPGGGMGLGPYVHEALLDALAIHNNTRQNFKQFDVKENNGGGDGRIDAILFLHSGYGAETGLTDCHGTEMRKLIWSHEWSMPTPWTSHDGVRIQQYALNSAMYGDGRGTEMTGGGEEKEDICINPPPIARVGSLVHEIMQ